MLGIMLATILRARVMCVRPNDAYNCLTLTFMFFA